MKQDGAGIRTGMARAIWMHVCREGGKWTAQEIAQHLGQPRQKVSLTMHRMATHMGSLRRYSTNRPTKFGVTSACKVPQGVSLDDLASLGALRVEAA